MITEELNTLEKSRKLITSQLYPTLFEIMKDLGLKEIIFTNVEGMKDLKINSIGDFFIMEGNEFPIICEASYNEIVESQIGFVQDSLENLRVQILLFSEEIVKRKKQRNEILSLLKNVSSNSEIFDDYYKIMLIEKKKK